MNKTDCPIHGEQGIGLVCTHIAHAVDRGEKVGFFWANDEDLARPDAWCAECERALIEPNGISREQWLANADFKILCAACWDEAKAVCGGFTDS